MSASDATEIAALKTSIGTLLTSLENASTAALADLNQASDDLDAADDLTDTVTAIQALGHGLVAMRRDVDGQLEHLKRVQEQLSHAVRRRNEAGEDLDIPPAA